MTGGITGIITDPTGASIANRTVTATNDATGESLTATSNTAGEYRFPLLRPGTYTLTAIATGFQPTTQKVTVNLGQVSITNFQLGIASSTQVVNVTEAARLVQNDNANLTTAYDSLQLENLPAPGLDMTSYAFSAPGVTISTGGGYGNFSARLVFPLPQTCSRSTELTTWIRI